MEFFARASRPIPGLGSLAELDATFLRPRRPRLDEARACVLGLHDPRERWEALVAADLLPASWVDDPLRRFRIGPGERTRALKKLSPEALTHVAVESGQRVTGAVARIPWRERDQCLFAADVAQIERAESLARECARRWSRWTERPRVGTSTRTTWRVEHGNAPRSHHAVEERVAVWRVRDPRCRVAEVCHGLAFAMHTAMRIEERRSWGLESSPWYDLHRPGATLPAGNPPWRSLPAEVPFSTTPRGQSLARLAFALRDASATWQRGVGKHSRRRLASFVPPEVWLPASLAHAPIGEIEDPFAPALELLATGYLLSDWTSTTVLLDAPAEA